MPIAMRAKPKAKDNPVAKIKAPNRIRARPITINSALTKLNKIHNFGSKMPINKTSNPAMIMVGPTNIRGKPKISVKIPTMVNIIPSESKDNLVVIFLTSSAKNWR